MVATAVPLVHRFVPLLRPARVACTSRRFFYLVSDSTSPLALALHFPLLTLRPALQRAPPQLPQLGDHLILGLIRFDHIAVGVLHNRQHRLEPRSQLRIISQPFFQRPLIADSCPCFLIHLLLPSEGRFPSSLALAQPLLTVPALPRASYLVSFTLTFNYTRCQRSGLVFETVLKLSQSRRL